MAWSLRETGPWSACSRLDQDSEPSTVSQQIQGHRSRSRQESRITNSVTSRLWYKTYTITPIGRSSLPHNGWRLITDRKVRVPQNFQLKPQASTSCISVVEVRNMHGERVDRELSLTELIDSLRNAPRFAQQDGITSPLHLRIQPTFFSRTRALLRQGYSLSSRLENLGQDL